MASCGLLRGGYEACPDSGAEEPWWQLVGEPDSRCLGYLQAVGQVHEAESLLREGIQKNPNNGRLHLNLGNLQDQIGQRDAALASYQRAITLDPQNAVFHYNLGLLYDEMGREADALNSLQESQRLAPDPLTEEHIRKIRDRTHSKSAEPSR